MILAQCIPVASRCLEARLFQSAVLLIFRRVSTSAQPVEAGAMALPPRGPHRARY